MYIYVYAYVYTYICVYIYIDIYVRLYINICIYAWTPDCDITLSPVNDSARKHLKQDFPSSRRIPLLTGHSLANSMTEYYSGIALLFLFCLLYFDNNNLATSMTGNS